MKSYFFFGFHILKYLSVTFMCQLYLAAALIKIKITYEVYLSISKRSLKFLIRLYLNINLKNFKQQVIIIFA